MDNSSFTLRKGFRATGNVVSRPHLFMTPSVKFPKFSSQLFSNEIVDIDELVILNLAQGDIEDHLNLVVPLPSSLVHQLYSFSFV